LMEQPTEQANGNCGRSRADYCPNVDLIESSDKLVLRLDMPGSDPESIDVNFENGTLTIHGKVPSRRQQDDRFIIREYGVGDFDRTFKIGESIDAGKISAQYTDGVLSIELPKAEEAKPRKIGVQVK